MLADDSLDSWEKRIKLQAIDKAQQASSQLNGAGLALAAGARAAVAPYMQNRQKILSDNSLDSWEKKLKLKQLDILNGKAVGPDGAPDEDGINSRTGRPNINGYDMTDKDITFFTNTLIQGLPVDRRVALYVKLKQNNGTISGDDLKALGIAQEQSWLEYLMPMSC